MLLNLMLADPEADKVKAELTKHTEDVKKLACKITMGELMYRIKFAAKKGTGLADELV